MKITPGFVAAAVVCAAPFALAIREDLQANSDQDALARYANEMRAREVPGPSDYEEPSETKEPITLVGLDELFGAAPASLGPVLTGLELGASSETFLGDAVRERLEAYKADHEVTIDYDFDYATLNGITIRGDGVDSELRDAMLARWGQPRRLEEGELVWLGDNGQRAVYQGLYDGFEMTITKYATVEDTIAPADKTKLGVEPYPLLGTKLDKLAATLGARLVETSYDDERRWTAPGVGTGAGHTNVRVSVDEQDRIRAVSIDGSTIEGDAIRAALIQKLGKPTLSVDDEETLTWKRAGVTTTAVIDNSGFSISQQK